MSTGVQKLQRRKIIESALEVSRRNGYRLLTLETLAKEFGSTESLIRHYFGSIKEVRKTLMKKAVKEKIYPIISDGLFLKDEEALKAPVELKRAAILELLRKE